MLYSYLPLDIAPLSNRSSASSQVEVAAVSTRPAVLNTVPTPPSVRVHRQQHQQQIHQQQQQQQQRQQQSLAAKEVAAALDTEMHLMSMQRLLLLQDQNKEQEDAIRHLKVRFGFNLVLIQFGLTTHVHEFILRSRCARVFLRGDCLLFLGEARRLHCC